MKTSCIIGIAAILAVRVGCLAAENGTRALPSSSSASVSPEIVQTISAVEVKLESALAERNRTALEALIAEPFLWVHGSDGRVETRDVWLAAAAKGMALSGQRNARTEHGVTIAAYGTAEPETVVRVARVQLRDHAQNRKSWMRQTHVFVRGRDGQWRLASGQGTLMYEGPTLDPELHARYPGTYVINPGRTLKLTWDDGALIAVFPSGATTQIFLASPTEEAVRTIGAGGLRFTLGPDGRPVAVALRRGKQEIWHATRAEP